MVEGAAPGVGGGRGGGVCVIIVLLTCGTEHYFHFDRRAERKWKGVRWGGGGGGRGGRGRGVRAGVWCQGRGGSDLYLTITPAEDEGAYLQRRTYIRPFTVSEEPVADR